MDSNLEAHQKLKHSEQVFLANADEAQAQARKANRIYNTVSKGVLSFGIAFAVALPLSMLSNPSDTPTSRIESETHYNYATAPDNQQPVRLEAVIKNIVGIEAHEQTTSTNPQSNLLVHVTAPDIEIRGVPPLNREWHRAVFRNRGDALWALPSVDLVISLNELNECSDAGCIASFDLESERYLKQPIARAFSFQETPVNCNRDTAKRCLEFSSALVKDDAAIAENKDSCEIEPNPTAPITLCRFKQSGEPMDMCLWVRMSTAPPAVTEPLEVALDVKWNTMLATEDKCVDRLNQTINE